MENKTSVIVLIIVVVVVGIFVAVRLAKIGNVNSVVSPAVQPGQPSATAPFTLASGLPQPPAPNAPSDEVGRFGQKIALLAKDTNVIEVGMGCVLTPAVAKLKVGSLLTLKNKDASVHRVSLLEMTELPAHGEKIITAQFKGAGIYGVNCDGPKTVGFIQLTK